MANPYARQYTQVQTATIGPEQLLLLLYEGAIRFLGRAREDLEAGRLGPGKTALNKGMAIIAELQNSLDAEAGWTGAEDLAHLYGHMILELTQANLTGDLDRVDAVRDLLTGLYDAWKEAIESRAAKAPAEGGAPAGTAGEGTGTGADTGDRAPFRTHV
jgi:flagellar protein FliS